MNSNLIVGPVAVAFLGCSGILIPVAKDAPGKSAPGVTADCKDWAHIYDGPYTYENNTWGSSKSSGDYEQCLLERSINGKRQVGWTWSWPGVNPSVFAYPEIIYGWKPWSGGQSSDPKLPINVKAIRSMTLTFDVEMTAAGSYNLAPEIWLDETGDTPSPGNPKLITTEIMFWMDHAGDSQPAGSQIDSPAIGADAYDLFHMPNIGDKGNGQGWDIYTFKSATVRHKGVIPIDALIAYMVDKKFVKPTEYVASVEFGNEVVGGTGTTWVKQYEVKVNP
jgi:hypothetical protein